MSAYKPQEPTETTSLLQNNVPVPVIASLTGPNTSKLNGNGVDSPQPPGGSDEENGEVEQPDNPLFEGQPDVAQKMYLLFPAVALGVSVPFQCLVEMGEWLTRG
jgi:hypothetical protein